LQLAAWSYLTQDRFYFPGVIRSATPELPAIPAQVWPNWATQYALLMHFQAACNHSQLDPRSLESTKNQGPELKGALN